MFQNFKSNLLNILFWSVISAAFIGPGTLATATAAGAGYQLQLLWTLGFAVAACLVFQEMAARMTIATGKDLNELIATLGRGWLLTMGLSVILGCAAYEAGNILGAVSGIQLLVAADQRLLTLFLGILAFLALYFNSISHLSRILGFLVAIMGLVFIGVACQTSFSFNELMKGMFIPEVPAGSEWIILGLVGTTVVPYNLFLGSGISKGQSIGSMRLGLAVSVIFGGLISMAILISGMNLSRFDDFYAFAVALGDLMGPWAKYLLGIGLFAAGFTSMVTAPLAAGLIAKGLFRFGAAFRVTWIGVLCVGVFFGVLAYKPLPVIIAAQALNGFILPVLAVLLLLYANDRKLLGNLVNGFSFNCVSLVLLNVLILIGINNIYKALSEPLAYPVSTATIRYLYMELVALPVMAAVIFRIKKLRH